MHSRIGLPLASAILAVVLFATALPATADMLQNAALKRTVTDRTVLLDTGYGFTVPIRYRSNGTMSAKSAGAAAYIGFSKDNGRWWIKKDQLCQRWNRWLSGKTKCFRLKVKGRKITWISSSGKKGTARILN